MWKVYVQRNIYLDAQDLAFLENSFPLTSISRKKQSLAGQVWHE